MKSSYRTLHHIAVTGVFAAGALALSSVGYAAPAAQPAGGIAQLNNSLFAPGALALNAADAGVGYRTAGVSSSTDAVDTEVESLSAVTASGEGEGSGASGQYGGRRRSYGRSRYEDRLHNADGSTKIAFVGGAGLNLPVGNTGKFYTPSYAIEVGGGYNFSRKLGILAEFHYDHTGLTGGAINYEYNNLINDGITADELTGFDANGHFIAITVNPVFNYQPTQGKFGAYVTGGVGYYRKTTNFTLPEIGTACDYYYCYQYSSNVNVDQYSASGFGANGGVGLTYGLSQFSSKRLFLEARYHWINLSTSNNTDFFPFNRRNSEYVPITFGLRF